MPPLPLSAPLSRVAASALDRKSAQLGALLAHWESILGPRLAAVSFPERLSRSRSPEGGCTLYLAVPSAWKTEFQHEAPLLLRRINTFFGHGAITAIRLTARAMPAPRAVKRAKPLSPERLAELELSVASVADPRLRAALIGLGQASLEQP